MSQIEEILYEAWELGIQDKVMQKVKEYQQICGSQGVWYDQKVAYEEAFQKAKQENENGISRSTETNT